MSIASAALFAQQGHSGGGARSGSPSVSGPSSPSMPTITSPTIGSGYYMPGNVANPAYTRKSSQQKRPEAGKTDSSEKKTSVVQKKPVLSAGNLTAGDLQALSRTGMLGPLGSILGNTEALVPESSRTDEMLQQVLTQIEELKAQNVSRAQESSAVQQSVPVQVDVQAQVPVRSNNPHLIRFVVNGYNILQTCRTIYISDVQNDGTFLVTGDRRYESDGKARTETFHILFRTAATTTSLQNYTAAAAVTQDSTNQYSFLYQLAQRDNLQAQRTGNLIAMRTTDPDWKLELLIDLGE